MKWDELTQEAKHAWIAEHVMHTPVHVPCTDGEMNPYLGSYWHCSCGWVSDFYIGEGNMLTKHTKPLPAYTQDWNAAWQLLQAMVRSEQHHRAFRLALKSLLALPVTDPIRFSLEWIADLTPQMVGEAAYRAVTGEEA